MAKTYAKLLSAAASESNTSGTNADHGVLQDLISQFQGNPDKATVKAILGNDSDYNTMVDNNWSDTPGIGNNAWNQGNNKANILKLLKAISKLDFDNETGIRPPGFDDGVSSKT